VTVDFATLAAPDDRVIIVATEPLTHGEAWQTIAPGELRVFVAGAPA
jgi:predicted glutamine amidotransferase